MFFFYKAGYKHAASETIPCGTIDGKDVVVDVSQGSFQVFWIPVVPLPKKVDYYDLEGNKLRKSNLNPAALEKAREIKAALPIRKRSFTGLVIFFILFTMAYFAHQTELKERQAFMDDPQPYDAYLYEIHPNVRPERELKYSYYIVNRVEGDVVIMSELAIAYTDRATAREDLFAGFVNTPETSLVDFQPYEVVFTKEELQEKYDSEMIADVDRHPEPHAYVLPEPSELQYSEAEIHNLYLDFKNQE